MKRAAFAVPGNLEIPTGGYAYDRRIIFELERLGWHIDLFDVGEGFPWPNEATLSGARKSLSKVAAGERIVIDGLALGAMPEIVLELAHRNSLLALVHHPLALEWGLSPDRADILRRSERAALALTQGVVVTSPATARIVTSEYNVPSDRITVARPGNDPVPRARGSRDTNVPHLLSVGAVVPRKGFDVLVTALATLASLPWRLTIAGDLTRDATAAATLHSEIARYRLTNRIAVLGAVSSDQLATLYHTADLFVLASYFEGYGMAYSEALAHGLPVIGTTAGVAEMVPQDAALLVPIGDAIALAEALRGAISDFALRSRLAEASFAAARRLPTWRQSGLIFAGALERLA